MDDVEMEVPPIPPIPPASESERVARVVAGVQRVSRKYNEKNGFNWYESYNHRLRNQFHITRPLYYFTTRMEEDEETKGGGSSSTSTRGGILRLGHALPIKRTDRIMPHRSCQVCVSLCASTKQDHGQDEGECTCCGVRDHGSRSAVVAKRGHGPGATRHGSASFSKRRAILLAEPNARQHNQHEHEYFPQWQFFDDKHNHYMTTDYASNGSLYLYANKRFNLYTETLAGLAPPDDSSYPAAVAKLWREEVLFIFSGLVRAVEFMHSKGVCHLDLDVHTIVIDSSGNPIIVDFGSSEVAEADGFVGRGRSILCKPHYRAPEVHNHNHNPKGSPGRAADMYSLGLYWLLFIYPPRGNIIIDPVTQHGLWRHHLFQHLEQDFAGHDEDTCVFQFHDPLDRNIAQILEGLLQTQPESRTKACELRENIEGYNYQIQDDTRTRCQALVEEFLSIAADES